MLFFIMVKTNPFASKTCHASVAYTDTGKQTDRKEGRTEGWMVSWIVGWTVDGSMDTHTDTCTHARKHTSVIKQTTHPKKNSRKKEPWSSNEVNHLQSLCRGRPVDTSSLFLRVSSVYKAPSHSYYHCLFLLVVCQGQ